MEQHDSIRTPVQGWQPLGKNSWIESAPPAPKARSEYAIAYAGGRVDAVHWDTVDEARAELMYQRSWLARLEIPEEYWPVLMERDVETVASSWRVRSE